MRRTVTAPGLAAILAVLLTVGCAVTGPKAAPPVTRGTLPATVAPTPTYAGKAEPIPAALRDLMVGRSWRPGCPVGLDQLRLLTVTYWGFDGRVHGGNLVIHQAHAQAVVGVFGALFAARFPIERIQLVDDFGANDAASMAANNTSAFNCRNIDGQPGVWSEHSYGWAIDINPVQNPWVRGIAVDPPAGAPYADRTRTDRGMIHADDAVVGAFRFIGWTWGGTFRNAKDYQHFSATGR